MWDSLRTRVVVLDHIAAHGYLFHEQAQKLAVPHIRSYSRLRRLYSTDTSLLYIEMHLLTLTHKTLNETSLLSFVRVLML